MHIEGSVVDNSGRGLVCAEVESLLSIMTTLDLDGGMKRL